MRYPDLVRPRFCTTPIGVVLYGEDLTEDGAPEIALKASLFCNWQDGAKTVLTKEQKRVEVSGRALFCGDICPDLAVISGGTAEVFGVRRTIARGVKARNPDGTVNYTELDVM